MQYSIILQGKNKDPEWFNYALLPGFIPEHVLNMMEALFVGRELGLCHDCPMACSCHVIWWDKSYNHGKKLCTILFHDAVKPKWKLKNVV